MAQHAEAQASHHGSDIDMREKFLGFHCNFTNKDGECCNTLVQEGWITGCCHLFCLKHAKEWFSNNDACPKCQNDRINLIRMNFTRFSGKSGGGGRNSMVGMLPHDIMRATETALRFWLNQKALDFQGCSERRGMMSGRVQKLENRIDSELRAAEDQCKGMEEEHNSLKQQIVKIEKETVEAQSEAASLKPGVAKMEQMCASLMKRISGQPQRDVFRSSHRSEHVAKDGGSSSFVPLQPSGESLGDVFRPSLRSEVFGKGEPSSTLPLGTSPFPFGNTPFVPRGTGLGMADARSALGMESFGKGRTSQQPRGTSGLERLAHEKPIQRSLETAGLDRFGNGKMPQRAHEATLVPFGTTQTALGAHGLQQQEPSNSMNTRSHRARAPLFGDQQGMPDHKEQHTTNTSADYGVMASCQRSAARSAALLGDNDLSTFRKRHNTPGLFGTGRVTKRRLD